MIFIGLLFLLFIGFVVYMIIGSFENPPDVPHKHAYRKHYYDDLDDDEYDSEYGFYGDEYERGYLDGFNASYNRGLQNSNSSSQQKKEEPAWKPLPDYVDDYGYYCPECDADLFDDHCEHEDDWT